ncbi:MAG TPA: ABC transporter permease [Firmicutes bacterium]|nr:ABC transporter permease [Bacillota bacterium]
MKRLNIDLSSPTLQKRMAPFISVLMGFVIGFVLLFALGYNPVEGFSLLFQGGFAGIENGNLKSLGNTLLQMTPLVLTGLSVAFAFRTGLFNIGAGGQMLVGGFAAVYLGVTLELPVYLHLPIVIVGSALAGAAWAIIPGLLKAKFKIHEVVTSIMMNYIALWGVQYLVKTLIPGKYPTESATIYQTATLKTEWMSSFFTGSSVNLGLFIAIFAAIVVWFILEKTTFGYELKAVGFNQNAAEYAGMKVKRNIIISMVIAGALAGLAGATFYVGYTNHIKIGVIPTHGFDGIAVSLLGLNSPVGVVLSSFLFGFMKVGGEFMQAMSDVPKELVDIIISTIIYFSAASLLVQGFLKKIMPKGKNGGVK